jgi:hypothetical protein
MKSIVRSAVLGMVCAAFAAAVPALAQDKAKPSADKAKSAAPAKDAATGKDAGPPPKVLLDNPKVRATEVRFKPGEGSGMRERQASLTRAETDGTMERTYPDGKKETVNWKAGEVRWFPKETFSNKNVGKKDIVLFVVEPK